MKIAIVGATGKVGRMMLTCLAEYQIKISALDLYASKSSIGKEIVYNNDLYHIKETTADALRQSYDYILFAAGGSVSREYATVASENGSIVIDNSSAFRTDSHVPLIVPEINGHLLAGYHGIISNPNCSTIQLVLLLHPISLYKKIKKVVVTTMQSVSGSGYQGIMELHNQRNGSQEQKLYPRQIYLNVIPQVGDFMQDGYCQEEQKMSFETKKILSIPDFSLVATTCRVPVVYGHSESVYIEFFEEVNALDIATLLSEAPAVSYTDEYITPLELEDSNLSHVSRVRYAGDKRSILLWNVADNVRLGAATNAVKILKQHHAVNS
jgi:aspartate-semialdehyde dehydrogenase